MDPALKKKCDDFVIVQNEKIVSYLRLVLGDGRMPDIEKLARLHDYMRTKRQELEKFERDSRIN